MPAEAVRGIPKFAINQKKLCAFPPVAWIDQSHLICSTKRILRKSQNPEGSFWPARWRCARSKPSSNSDFDHNRKYQNLEKNTKMETKFVRKISASYKALKKRLSFTDKQEKNDQKSNQKNYDVSDTTSEIMEAFIFESLLGRN